jgi:hypothetical protein
VPIGLIKRGDLILVALDDEFGLYVVDSIDALTVFAFPIARMDVGVVEGGSKETPEFRVSTFATRDIFAVFSASSTSP